jgi:hypothetical protein
MKTSNKILLGAFVLLIVLASTPVIIVRAKYASGNIVKEAPGEQNKFKDTYGFKEPIKRVVISNLGEVLIVPADTASLAIWKSNGDNKLIKQFVKDGVLYITFGELTATKQFDNDSRVYNHIELFLPPVDSIYAVNSSLQIRGKADTASVPSYNIQLFQTGLSIQHEPGKDGTTYFNQLKVNAQPGSNLRFDGKLHVSSATFSMDHTDFEDNDEISFGKLTLQTDSASSIRIKGKNLRNATITSKE